MKTARVKLKTTPCEIIQELPTEWEGNEKDQ